MSNAGAGPESQQHRAITASEPGSVRGEQGMRQLSSGRLAPAGQELLRMWHSSDALRLSGWATVDGQAWRRGGCRGEEQGRQVVWARVNGWWGAWQHRSRTNGHQAHVDARQWRAGAAGRAAGVGGPGPHCSQAGRAGVQGQPPGHLAGQVRGLVAWRSATACRRRPGSATRNARHRGG